MKKTNTILVTMAVASLLSGIGCSSMNRTSRTDNDANKVNPITRNETEAAREQGASIVSSIHFNQGSRDLDARAKEELNAAISRAKQNGEVEKVTIAVWPDAEYPVRNEKLSSSQVNLADNRGEEIEKYLERELDVDDVKIHNMGKKPNYFADLFNTSDARLKERLINEGVSSSDDNRDIMSRNRASSALIMVETK